MSETNPKPNDERDAWISDFEEDYGLIYLPKRTDEKGSNHDKGIVTDGRGNYYKISDFVREQSDDLDTDQGIQELSGSLYRDAQRASDGDYSVTNWNTAGDVEGALEVIAGTFDALDEVAAEQVEDEPYVPSEEISDANAMVGNWEQSILDGSFSESVYGNSKNKRAGALAGLAAAQVDDSPAARNAVFDSYKLKLSSDLRPSIQSLLNADRVVNGGPFKSSSGNDAQTQFPGPAGAAGSDSWVWNQ